MCENITQKKIIWIAWERQRRTLELSKELKSDLCIIDIKKRNILRYIESSLMTISHIRTESPDILIVQNPSIVLTFLVAIIKPAFNYKLVVDRHTNFKFDKRKSLNPKWIFFHILSKYTIKKSDLTIVTNKHLKLLINLVGGKGAILPDKLPEIPTDRIDLGANTQNASLFICTFSDDEPYSEIFGAAKLVPNLTLYVTGNYRKKISKRHLKDIPKNVVLLGFIPDMEYFKYLMSVDFTIVLTSQEYTLNCGAYESVASKKPMLLSNTKTIRNYFRGGAVYVDPSNFSKEIISDKIYDIISQLDILNDEVVNLKETLSESWKIRSEEIKHMIECL